MIKLNTNQIIGAILGVVVLFVTVYYAGTAWKRSQEGRPLIGKRSY